MVVGRWWLVVGGWWMPSDASTVGSQNIRTFRTSNQHTTHASAPCVPGSMAIAIVDSASESSYRSSFPRATARKLCAVAATRRISTATPRPPDVPFLTPTPIPAPSALLSPCHALLLGTLPVPHAPPSAHLHEATGGALAVGVVAAVAPSPLPSLTRPQKQKLRLSRRWKSSLTKRKIQILGGS